jgi:hypothetical protein
MFDASLLQSQPWLRPLVHSAGGQVPRMQSMVDQRPSCGSQLGRLAALHGPCKMVESPATMPRSSSSARISASAVSERSSIGGADRSHAARAVAGGGCQGAPAGRCRSSAPAASA